jgi:SAM-dependent methyltransferase
MSMTTEQDFWRERWQGNRTGWDLGGPHEGLEPLLELLDETGALGEPGVILGPAGITTKERSLRIYSPGCGRAHDGAAIIARSVKIPPSIAARNIEVFATDFAPEAIDAARGIYGHLSAKGLRLAVQDASAAVPETERAKFHVIFDRAMLCALRPELRPAYLRACHERLIPGGVFLSLPFTRIEDTPEHPPGSGPPFEINLRDLESLMIQNGFELVAARSMIVRRPDTIIKEEGLTVFRAVK